MMVQYLEQTQGYQPGVCNIGPAEIRRRRRIGYLGVAGAVALGAVLVLVDVPSWSRLAVAAPLMVGFSGFIQAHLRFCAGFGMAGLRNMDELGAQVAVDDADARAADRRTALRIHGASVAGALALAVAFALLPA
jgi:hypothetical protein